MSPLFCRRQQRPFSSLFWLTFAIQHCCKGRWHFWWWARADILSTDLYTWLRLSFMLHHQKDTISRDALAWPWGHSLHSKGQVTLIKMAVLQEGRRSCRSRACTTQRRSESGCTPTLCLPFPATRISGWPPAAVVQRARIQADHGIADVSREVTEALEWDIPPA